MFSLEFVSRAGFCVALSVIVLATSASAQTDLNALLKELKTIEDQQKQATLRRLGTLARQLMAASKTPAAAERVYVDAIKDTDFGAKNGDGGEFPEWKRKSKDLLNDKGVQVAMQMHLRYIAITLGAAAEPGQVPPVNELIGYVKNFLQARGQGAEDGTDATRDLVKKLYEDPISKGTIAQAYSIGTDLENFCGSSAEKKWALSAGNWKEILEINVRGPLRKLKDPRLLETWQIEIEAESGQMGKDKSDVVRAKFSRVELPRLLWAQAQDMVVLGQSANAISAMSKIVRTYPQHPDVLKWIAELRSLVGTEQAAPPTETSTPRPATPTAPNL